MSEFPNMTEAEKIRWAKNNWTAWGGLTIAQKDFLTIHLASVGMVDNQGKVVAPPMYLSKHGIQPDDLEQQNIVLRLRPDYGQGYDPDFWYFCEITWSDGDYLVMGANIKLHEALSRRDFGGVQFKGQKDEHKWWYCVRAFQNGEGEVVIADSLWPKESGEKSRLCPAIPYKARFKKYEN